MEIDRYMDGKRCSSGGKYQPTRRFHESVVGFYAHEIAKGTLGLYPSHVRETIKVGRNGTQTNGNGGANRFIPLPERIYLNGAHGGS